MSKEAPKVSIRPNKLFALQKTLSNIIEVFDTQCVPRVLLVQSLNWTEVCVKGRFILVVRGGF